MVDGPGEVDSDLDLDRESEVEDEGGWKGPGLNLGFLLALDLFWSRSPELAYMSDRGGRSSPSPSPSDEVLAWALLFEREREPEPRGISVFTKDLLCEGVGVGLSSSLSPERYRSLPSSISSITIFDDPPAPCASPCSSRSSIVDGDSGSACPPPLLLLDFGRESDADAYGFRRLSREFEPDCVWGIGGVVGIVDWFSLAHGVCTLAGYHPYRYRHSLGYLRRVPTSITPGLVRHPTRQGDEPPNVDF